MRWPRDFRRGRLYGVTQRGNNGQWIYIDKQDCGAGAWLVPDAQSWALDFRGFG